jgi:hypothetical protein
MNKTPIIKLIEYCIEQEKEHSSIEAMALAFENVRLKAEGLLYESDDYFEALQATHLNNKFDYEKEK